MSLVETSPRWMDQAAASFRAFQRTKLYDLLAASPIVSWYAFCEYQQLPALIAQLRTFGDQEVDLHAIASLSSKVASLIFVAVLGVMLIVRHTPFAKSTGIIPRISAIAGTYLGIGLVLQAPAELPASMHLLATLLILTGTVLSLYSVAYLGRSISMMPEARRLVTGGPYSLIRHPLYFAEAIALVGLAIHFFSGWSVLLLSIQCAFQIERMKNEERVLSSAFSEYPNYMARTARLIPGIY